jgi:hypothetical protein
MQERLRCYWAYAAASTVRVYQLFTVGLRVWSSNTRNNNGVAGIQYQEIIAAQNSG